MSFKTNLYAFLGNVYFWIVDPIICLYVKIKVRVRKVYRYIKAKNAGYNKQD